MCVNLSLKTQQNVKVVQLGRRRDSLPSLPQSCYLIWSSGRFCNWSPSVEENSVWIPVLKRADRFLLEKMIFQIPCAEVPLWLSHWRGIRYQLTEPRFLGLFFLGGGAEEQMEREVSTRVQESFLKISSLKDWADHHLKEHLGKKSWRWQAPSKAIFADIMEATFFPTLEKFPQIKKKKKKVGSELAAKQAGNMTERNQEKTTWRKVDTPFSCSRELWMLIHSHLDMFSRGSCNLTLPTWSLPFVLIRIPGWKVTPQMVHYWPSVTRWSTIYTTWLLFILRGGTMDPKHVLIQPCPSEPAVLSWWDQRSDQGKHFPLRERQLLQWQSINQQLSIHDACRTVHRDFL